MKTMVTLILLLTASVRAENWPGWRGPTGVGYTTEKNLPLRWEGKTGENVMWKASTGGLGHSTPVVWGDYVFLTTSARQPDGEVAKVVPDHHVIAFRVSDGRQLWRTRIAPGPCTCRCHEYAAPTPATDGKTVYAWFSSGVAAAVDFDGKLLWREQRDGVSIENQPACSSPVLFGDLVIIKCDPPNGKGFLQALDKRTGALKWEQKRPKVYGSLTSPILIEVNEKPQLVVSGQGLEGIHPADGTLIWKVSAGEGTPAYGSGLVVAYSRRYGEKGVAVAPSGSGDVTATHVRTKFADDGFGGGFSSPIIAQGHVYCNPDFKKLLNCWNLKTGELVYKQEVKEMPDYSSGIATADGLLYYVSAGSSVIVRAGPKFELLAVNSLGGGDGHCGPSAAVSNGRIFVRDFNFLWCIGGK
jgi:outer membrane protein assembly factor BamB